MFNKSGYAFVLDAFFAGIILTFAFIVVSGFSHVEVQGFEVKNVVDSFMNYISSTKSLDTFNPYIYSKVEDGNITNLESSILTQISYFYYKNQTGSCDFCLNISKNISQNLVEQIIPVQYGVDFKIGNYSLYSRKYNQRYLANNIYTSRMLTYVMVDDSFFGGPEVVSIEIWD